MKPKQNHAEFQAEINNRGIQYLVHFTRFEGITSIVGQREIVPRREFGTINYEWQELISPNCDKRRDDDSFLNTSIMHPNYYLLGVFQNKWHPGSKFCVIGINPKYIFEVDTKFAISNATYRSTIKYGINGQLGTFRAMFSEKVIVQQRTVTRPHTLPAYYPTHFEAEVLIRSRIPYDDIMFIACRDKFEFDFLASAFDVLNLPTEKFCVRPTLFEDR